MTAFFFLASDCHLSSAHHPTHCWNDRIVKRQRIKGEGRQSNRDLKTGQECERLQKNRNRNVATLR